MHRSLHEMGVGLVDARKVLFWGPREIHVHALTGSISGWQGEVLLPWSTCLKAWGIAGFAVQHG